VKTVSVALAQKLCQAVFVDTMNTPPHIADVVIDALIEANLRGIDSHGIRVLPHYLEKWSVGQIVPGSEPAVVKETKTTAMLDAGQGLGHYASFVTMNKAISSAREHGLGSAVVRQSTHNGAISHYTIQAAHRGMIGIAATACAPHVAPYGGTTGVHGTNPISYAFPREQDDPLVFDFSTGHSGAKMKNHAEREGLLPENRVINAAGRPTTNPAELKDGWILPVAGHVGYGFGLLVDGLTAGLADSPIGRQMPLASETSGPYYGSFFALAICPDAFGGSGPFEERFGYLIHQLESNQPQDPAKPVRWPGQRGWQFRKQRLREGIPIPKAQWDSLIERLSAHRVDVGEWLAEA